MLAHLFKRPLHRVISQCDHQRIDYRSISISSYRIRRMYVQYVLMEGISSRMDALCELHLNATWISKIRGELILGF